MDASIKRKIARGVRKAAQRKRMSEAMKASWVRRRNTASPTKTNNIYEVAQMILGPKKVRDILATMIKESL
jgi:hypothetical protein